MPDFGLKYHHLIVHVSSLLCLATHDVHLFKLPHSLDLDLMHLSQSQFLSSQRYFSFNYLPFLRDQL